MRILKHLLLPDWWLRRAIRKPDLDAIEAAIAASEASHRGEIRVVIETSLPLSELRSGRDVRARAIDAFARCHVWDTEENSGVLIYIDWTDREAAILADRGVARQAEAGSWDTICARMVAVIASDGLGPGVTGAIREVGALLATHFPAAGHANPDELPNRPLLR
jgi:uncharacterized membrane protein